MGIAVALPRFNGLGHLVTPIFLLRDHRRGSFEMGVNFCNNVIEPINV